MPKYLLVFILTTCVVAFGAASARSGRLFASAAQPARLQVSQHGASALTLEWARGHVDQRLAGHVGELMMDGTLVVGHFGVEAGGAVNASFIVPEVSPGTHQIEARVAQHTLLTSTFVVTRAAGAMQRVVTVHVFPREVIGRSNLNTGVTLTQHTVNPWGNPAAVLRGRALLTSSASFQNQSIYGWGTLNPEPQPGHFDWTSLDARVQLMRSLHAKVVITLCCSPDWMTSSGKDTSKYTLLAPTPRHYGDFADLAKRVAQRYPDVHYFQVWNEMKGFWDLPRNNWDYVGYTTFYNRVYDALKSVNPRIQVGGPYIELEGSGTNLGHWSQEPAITNRNLETLLYWLHHKHGADFITLDRTAKAVHDPLRYTPALVLEYTAQFEAIAHEIHALTRLPIWWSEERFQGGAWNFQAVGLASIMYHELLGGAAATLSWQPDGENGNTFGGNYQNLFSDTTVRNGGRPFPYYWVFLDFHRYFGPGTALLRTAVSSSDVKALASPSHVLLINQQPESVHVHVGGQTVQMNGYSIRLVNL